MTVWYRATKNLLDGLANNLSGNGGLFAAGRWNHLGRRVVYCSESIALCTLEWLAHHGLSVSGFNCYRFSIDIPDNLITRFTKANLPTGWNKTPATDATRDFAEEKLFNSPETLAIAVPSVIVPEECNLIIDPTHPSFQKALKTLKTFGEHLAPTRN